MGESVIAVNRIVQEVQKHSRPNVCKCGSDDLEEAVLKHELQPVPEQPVEPLDHQPRDEQRAENGPDADHHESEYVHREQDAFDQDHVGENAVVNRDHHRVDDGWMFFAADEVLNSLQETVQCGDVDIRSELASCLREQLMQADVGPRKRDVVVAQQSLSDKEKPEEVNE